jgi:GNAT superfamily N-acetyltransferase
MSDVILRHVETATDIAVCFPMMVQLRPHLKSAEELVTRVIRQREAGYRLLVAWHGAAPLALAGYRLEDNLLHGRFVYVDDLVTTDVERGRGIGATLLDAVATEGRRSGCGRPVLDTALDNVLGHRFYYRQGLLARALRFSRPISAA